MSCPYTAKDCTEGCTAKSGCILDQRRASRDRAQWDHYTAELPIRREGGE